MPKVLTPTGAVVDMTDEQAQARLAMSGYSLAGPGTEDSAPGDELRAGILGTARGLTFGLSDLALTMKDKAGNPVLSNAEEKVLALVDKKNGVLSLFRTDDKGAQISDGDKPAKAFLTIGLDRFTDLTTNPRTLEVGQGAVTGPASAELVDAFKAVLGAKAEKKAKPSQPGM